ncbi:hypothetical protein HDZ31DRAFT_66718 [Schizophyllum fasciatum]
MPAAPKPHRRTGRGQANSTQRPNDPKILFGINQGLRSQGRAANPFDYEQKYDEDEFGDEMGPSARFWRVLLDEGQIYDNEMIDGWRDTLDVLLVFAGLFSAVVTTLVAQSSTALQPDYAQLSAALMIELIAIQRAWATGASIEDVAPSPLTLDTVTATALDYWCNACWFVSLALSLSAALVAVLAKQWIQAYKSNTYGTPEQQALVRQFRLMGMERWHVRLIVGLLPMLLHLSLLLFFVGLSLYVLTFNDAIAWIIIGIAGMVYSLYSVTSIMPMIDCQCPYRTPLSDYGYVAVKAAISLVLAAVGARFDGKSDLPADALPTVLEEPEPLRWAVRLRKWIASAVHVLRAHRASRPHEWTARSREAAIVHKRKDRLTQHCLSWIYSTSSNPTVASITLQAISGLHPSFKQLFRDEPMDCRDRMIDDILAGLHTTESMTNDMLARPQDRKAEDMQRYLRQQERLARSLLFFDELAHVKRATNVAEVMVSILLGHYDPRLESDATTRLQLVSLALYEVTHGEEYTPSPAFEFAPKLNLDALDMPFVYALARGGDPARILPILRVPLLAFFAKHGSCTTSEHSIHLAILLWRASQSDGMGEAAQARPTTKDAASLDYWTAAAIHRLLFMKWTHGTPRDYANLDANDIFTSIMDHVIRQLDHLYRSNESLVSRQHDSELCNLEVDFLASLVKHKWTFIDSFSQLAKLPLLSLETRSVCVSTFVAIQNDDPIWRMTSPGRPRVPTSSIRPLLMYIADLLPDPVKIRFYPSAELVSFENLCFSAMAWALLEHPSVGLGILTEDLLNALRPHALAIMDRSLADCSKDKGLMTGLNILITGYTSTLKDEIRVRSEDRPWLQRWIDCLSSPCTDAKPPSHLAWIVSVSIVCEALQPSVPWAMHGMILDLARITSTSHPAVWRDAVSYLWLCASHVSPKESQMVYEALQTPVGNDAYNKLMENLPPDLANVDNHNSLHQPSAELDAQCERDRDFGGAGAASGAGRFDQGGGDGGGDSGAGENVTGG